VGRHHDRSALLQAVLNGWHRRPDTRVIRDGQRAILGDVQISANKNALTGKLLIAETLETHGSLT
jgi:hypothetical protein